MYNEKANEGLKMETIVIIGAGASGLACMNELVKTNKYNINCLGTI